MSSNTSSTSGAGVSGDYATHILKKPKRQRVPKRGPGVAELEKILREQETNVINADKGNVPFVPDHHNISHLISRTPPPPPPPPLPMTMLFGNRGGNKRTFSGGRSSSGSNGVRMDGSGIILPEEAILPTVWNSFESSIYEEAHKIPAGYPISTRFVSGSDQMHMLQKKQYSHRYPYPAINLFPQSGSLPSPEKQTAAGFYVHVEPPSNQKSSHYIYSSMLPEEEKMVGKKRPRTFSMDNTSGSSPPIFHSQASSSPFSNHTTSTGFNLQRDVTLSRGDYGAMSGSFPIFGSRETPFTKRCSLPFQESSSESQQKKKPFYSFLTPAKRTRREEETTLSLKNERPPRRDTIDLNLKL